jgi:hypothetical protein
MARGPKKKEVSVKRSTVVMLLTAAALAGLAAALAPLSAQAQTSLPPLAPLSSVRIDYVGTFNGEVGIVCQEELSSEPGFSYHGTCHELASAQVPELAIDLVAGRITEYVYLNGVYYERIGDATTWTAWADPDYNGELSLNDALFSSYLYPSNAVITNVGRVTIDGTPATQYQFWSTDSELNELSDGQYVYDVFVTDTGLVLKDQVSQRGNLPILGEGELALVWTYKNFNGPVSIAAPPASQVQVGTAASATSPGLILSQAAR